MEPPTTKMWSRYDWSSWQSELSKKFSWRDRRKTFSEKFVKGTRRETRKNQWQRQQENSSKHQVRRSALQNGWKTKDYSASEARSMFPRIWTYGGEWSRCAMIRRSLDTLDAGKHWSWSPETTGDLKCLDISDSTLTPVISALGQNR